MQINKLVAALGMTLLIPAIAWALGADHTDRPIIKSDWPQGLVEVVNCDQWVHGYFVNAEDVFFYRGDTAELNAFLGKYAVIPNTKLEVVLHPGTLVVKSPWEEKPRAIAADWKLYTSPNELQPANEVNPLAYITRVDVWLGGAVELNKLHVPKGITLASGGEIEAFVKRHQQ